MLLLRAYLLWLSIYLCNMFVLPDIDECASNPCQNGGTCVDKINTFFCRCGNYHRGTTCEYGEKTLLFLGDAASFIMILCVRTQDEGYQITWVKGQVVLELVHNISVLCARRIYTVIILYSLYLDTPVNCANYISIHYLDLRLF